MLHSTERKIYPAHKFKMPTIVGILTFISMINTTYERLKAGNFLKGDSNLNDKCLLSERALWTMNFDTRIIKIGWKMCKLWAFKEFNMADIQPPFWIFNLFSEFLSTA